MEVKKTVATIQYDFKCPKCETGFLRPTGLCLDSNPPQYPHQCTKCDYTQTFIDKMYPYIKYDEIGVSS